MKKWEIIYFTLMGIIGIMSFLGSLNLYTQILTGLDGLLFGNSGFSVLKILPILLLGLGIVLVGLSALMVTLGFSPDQEMSKEFYGTEDTPKTFTPLLYLATIIPFVLATELYVVLTSLEEMTALSPNLIAIILRGILGAILFIIMLFAGLIGGSIACTIIYTGIMKTDNYKKHILVALGYIIIGYIGFLFLEFSLPDIALLLKFLTFFPALCLLIPIPHLTKK